MYINCFFIFIQPVQKIFTHTIKGIYSAFVIFSFISFKPKHLCPSRIIGETARSNDIYQSVSVQIQKNFAKSKWKVSS